MTKRIDRRTFVRGAAIGAGALIAGPASSLLPRAARAATPDGAFRQGVASGEPGQRAITVWTRLDELDRPAAVDLEVAAGRALLADALQATVDLRADYLGGVLYGVLGRHEAPVTERGYANAVEAMRELCDAAAREGVTIGLEVVNRYESDVLNTTEQALTFLDDIGADNATVHLDTYHMNIEEPGLAQAIETCGDRLGYFHVGESNRGPLGTGTVDFAEAFAALDRIGYNGTITFESFSSAVVSPALTRALCIWRETWDDGMELATSARRFVIEQRAAAAA